jgi:hypothetical protein
VALRGMATATSSSHTVCVYYCSTYYKAVRVGGGGETMEDMSPHLQGQPRQQREHAGRQRQRHLRRRPPAGRRRAFFLHMPWQWTATPSSADYGEARCVCVCVCVSLCACVLMRSVTMQGMVRTNSIYSCSQRVSNITLPVQTLY